MKPTNAELEAIVDQLPDCGEHVVLIKSLTVSPRWAGEDDDGDPDEIPEGATIIVYDYNFGPPWKQVEIGYKGEDYTAETTELYEAIGSDWRERQSAQEAINNPNQTRLPL